jgi:hypothetical protein
MSGPVASSKREVTETCATRTAAGSRTASGSDARSTTERGSHRLGTIHCTGEPSTSRKEVRRLSCRRTISFSARSRALVSSRPRRRRAEPMLKAGLPGSRRSRNQRRSWAKESGAVRGESGAGAAAGPFSFSLRRRICSNRSARCSRESPARRS